MLDAPTDRLHKFAAIGGLALAIAGGGGALRQYNETGIQYAEYVGSALKIGEVYNRFAAQAREQIKRNERLKSKALSEIEQETLQAETKRFKENVPIFDKEFEEAQAAAGKQRAITEHYYRMQAIWLVLAGASIVSGLFISYRGFKVWLAQPIDQR
jgi:Flp pilus assembly protein TadB